MMQREKQKNGDPWRFYARGQQQGEKTVKKSRKTERDIRARNRKKRRRRLKKVLSSM